MGNVLIVEDYESIKNLYVDAFIREGFEVDAAKSGAEGLEKAGQFDYDIIVVDILMMGLGGIEFLEGFMKIARPKTTVIVASNLDSPFVVQRATLLGATAYLIKSQYTPKQLVEAVVSLHQERLAALKK